MLNRSSAWFRVSEELDNFDHNEDGDLEDEVLVQNSLFECDPHIIGTMAITFGPAIAFADDGTGIAYLADESLEGVDFNEDGDADDLVVRYIRF